MEHDHYRFFVNPFAILFNASGENLVPLCPNLVPDVKRDREVTTNKGLTSEISRCPADFQKVCYTCGTGQDEIAVSAKKAETEHKCITL